MSLDDTLENGGIELPRYLLLSDFVGCTQKTKSDVVAPIKFWLEATDNPAVMQKCKPRLVAIVQEVVASRGILEIFFCGANINYRQQAAFYHFFNKINLEVKKLDCNTHKVGFDND